ncbi:MAG: hypothetical protein SGPRY_013990 [Prymnesium sp.]
MEKSKDQLKLAQLIDFFQIDRYRNVTTKFNHANALLIMHATSDFANFSFIYCQSGRRSSRRCCEMSCGRRKL